MKHLGDITKISGHSVPIVDIVVGGSPCQDLSVAGRRAGLDGERSGLFMEQVRIIKEMRDEYCKLQMRQTNELRGFIKPRFMVWENVPGAFSSNGGEDFRIVLEETARIADKNATIPELADRQKWTPAGCILGDGWSIAWRVHDAQFWGVPQRRKRIALVADFGGHSAPEILFEREGVSGDLEQSRQTREDPTRFTEESTRKAISFQERAGCEGGGKGVLIQNERTGALRSSAIRACFCLQGNGIDRADTAGCNGKGWREDQSYTLNTIDRPAVVYDASNITSPINKSQPKVGDPCHTLHNDNRNILVEGEPTVASKASVFLNGRSDESKPFICYGLDRASFNQGKNAQYDFSVLEEQSPTLLAKGPGGVLSRR